MKKTVEFSLQSEISESYRAQRACNSVDLDIKKKSVHSVSVEDIDLDGDWNIGVFYGASGSGKTMLAKHMFGDAVFENIVHQDKSIIDQMPEGLTYDECAAALSGIGLNSVPCWVRPFFTLSNGQKARAEAVLLMLNSSKEITAIDEWTSVVDREAAKVMSHCIKKYARKTARKIILLSCHADIIPWLEPDWVIDLNTQRFVTKHEGGFFLQSQSRSHSTSSDASAAPGDILASIII